MNGFKAIGTGIMRSFSPENYMGIANRKDDDHEYENDCDKTHLRSAESRGGVGRKGCLSANSTDRAVVLAGMCCASR